MAMIRTSMSTTLLAVDQLIAGIHFNPDVTPLKLVGRKAVARSLSDVAAMVARPIATLATVILPKSFDETLAMELFAGMRTIAADFEAPLVGGDIVIDGSGDARLSCTVTVLAEPWSAQLLVRTRSMAEAGDDVYVTGAIGGSYGRDGLGRHLTFEPRIEYARLLAEALGDSLHAVIDLSDGLGRDAGHVATQSGVRIELDAELLAPICNGEIIPAIREGEDYELLFTASETPPEAIGLVPITRIGSVLKAVSDRHIGVFLINEGHATPIHDAGWQHHT